MASLSEARRQPQRSGAMQAIAGLHAVVERSCCAHVAASREFVTRRHAPASRQNVLHLSAARIRAVRIECACLAHVVCRTPRDAHGTMLRFARTCVSVERGRRANRARRLLSDARVCTARKPHMWCSESGDVMNASIYLTLSYSMDSGKTLFSSSPSSHVR